MTDVPSPPLILRHRLGLNPPGPVPLDPVVLDLTADDRTRMRGLRHGRDRRSVLLELPRGEALRPGEWLATEDGLTMARVEAAAESLLLVRAGEPEALLRAAYHLGNRHVALEVCPGELRLLVDPVLEELLRRRGLAVRHGLEPFHPESGAYGGETIPHAHSHATAVHSLCDGPPADVDS